MSEETAKVHTLEQPKVHPLDQELNGYKNEFLQLSAQLGEKYFIRENLLKEAKRIQRKLRLINKKATLCIQKQNAEDKEKA